MLGFWVRCRFPGGHELFLLSQLEDLKNEIEKRQAKATTKLSEEISQLDSLTKAQDKKSQQSVSEFLWVREGKFFQGKIFRIHPQLDNSVIL